MLFYYRTLYLLIDVKSLTNQEGLVLFGMESLLTIWNDGAFGRFAGTESTVDPPHTWLKALLLSKLHWKIDFKFELKKA